MISRKILEIFTLWQFCRWKRKPLEEAIRFKKFKVAKYIKEYIDDHPEQLEDDSLELDDSDIELISAKSPMGVRMSVSVSDAKLDPVPENPTQNQLAAPISLGLRFDLRYGYSNMNVGQSY